MQMGMMVELLAPRMQHGKAPNLSAEMLGGPGDVLEGLRHGAKEQTVQRAGVLKRQG
jgi:hypothetical protein